MLRSSGEHRGEWYYYTEIARFTGHTAYEVYEEMVRKFLKIVDKTGEVAYLKPTHLIRIQWIDYIDNIRFFWSTMGLILPDWENVPFDFKIELKQMKTLQK